MEDNLSGTIGTNLTTTGSPAPVLVEDYPGTPSSINTESPTSTTPQSQNKQTKSPPVNQSIVWSHFKKVKPIDKDNPKAICNYCKRILGCHHKNGTSGMMTHLQSNCPTSPLKKSKLPKNQTLLQMSFKKTADGTSSTSPQMGFLKFDPDKIRSAIVRYFIKCELSFKHVESEGFKEFVNVLEPRCKTPSRMTLQRDCMKLYGEEKLKLKALLSGQRVCLTTDTWTSLQNLNYMCITVHFIDSDWIMHKKIIKFCLVLDHRGETIGKVLETTMIEWGIDSVFTITADNATANDVAIDYMKMRLKNRSSTVLGGEFLHMRCAAHILNLVVRDGIRELNSTISKIREAVRHVRSSPGRMAKFKECIELERDNIQCKKMVCLDVSTRWNSTYLMLSIAEKYQRAFDRMGEDPENKLNAPELLDWENARVFVSFLKTFYDATLNISGSKYVTSNLCFMELYIIQETLNEECYNSNPIVSSMGFNMRSKYEKYWGDSDKFNLILYVAFVVDPRYKMKALVFWLKECNGIDQASKIEASVRDLLKRLIEQYTKFHGGAVSYSDGATRSSNATSSLNVDYVDDYSKNKRDKFNSRFTQHLVEENDLECRSEVDRYLIDGCEATTNDFDVLGWWKMNAPKYPILAEIARDVLAVPISTVASESAFSTGGCVLNPFRSSLFPITFEALICTQNWIRDNPIDIRELEAIVESLDEQDESISLELPSISRTEVTESSLA